MEIRRLTIMMRVDDRARADLAFTPERTYYRFATDTSIEDGDLPAIPDFEATAARIVEAAQAREDEQALPADMKVQVFVNNALSKSAVSEQSLRRLIQALEPLAAEFSFLRGFV